jgi:hypothetical protein
MLSIRATTPYVILRIHDLGDWERALIQRARFAHRRLHRFGGGAIGNIIDIWRKDVFRPDRPRVRHLFAALLPAYVAPIENVLAPLENLDDDDAGGDSHDRKQYQHSHCKSSSC